MAKTHLFIAGHGTLSNGKFDPGATGVITKGEHKYMKEDLFPAIKRHLPKDHNIVFFDKYSVVSHGNLASLVKQFNANQVTEFHYDAGASTARGGHVIIHNTFSPDKTDLALRDAIDNMVGVRYSHNGHRGISGRSNLGNVNRAKNAGITYRLLELGFGTNANDAVAMTAKVDEYARQIVKAVTGKETKKVSKPEASKTGSAKVTKPKKSIDQLADEVIAGKHGSGDKRKQSLGSQYNAVQKRVNEKLGVKSKPKAKPKPVQKSIDQLVKETLAGKYGNGETRKKKLGKNYNAVMDVINGKSSSNKSKPGKSVSQMANMIINDPKVPKGHENRRKWLGISKAEYEKVRKEVNKRL